MYDPFGALYIHIPFCAQLCLYCDFATRAVAVDDPCIAAYVDSLISAIRKASRVGELGSLDTVYIGGGTPSYLGNKNLSNILYTLSLSMHLTPEIECTLEANPESFTEAMAKDLWALGVNRLSFGVQSFNDDLLISIGRIHTAQRAVEAIKQAQIRFENISIDLMCGLPGQTREMFLKDLAKAVELGITHISIYPLTLEENTPLSTLVDQGVLSEPDSDLQVDMMQDAAQVLTQAGFNRYEVASYARPGFESRHNTAYWTGVPYLGLGQGAITMMQDETSRVRLDSDEVIEVLNLSERYAEDLMLGMRMSRGVSQALIDEARPYTHRLDETILNLCNEGYVAYKDSRLVPTEKGWLFGNHVYGALLGCGIPDQIHSKH